MITNKKRMPILATSIQYSIVIVNNWTRETSKKNTNQKGRGFDK
jgi:hypothetical protein